MEVYIVSLSLSSAILKAPTVSKFALLVNNSSLHFSTIRNNEYIYIYTHIYIIINYTYYSTLSHVILICSTFVKFYNSHDAR